MSTHKRKNKVVEFVLGGAPTDEIDYACQLKTYKLNNNTPDGEVQYTYCNDPDDPDAGETRESAEPSWSLSGTLFADWRGQGFSRWSHQHDQEWVTCTLHIHSDVSAEHVWWVGQLQVKAVSVGGDARTDEMTDFEWQWKGKPRFYAESDLESDSN